MGSDDDADELPRASGFAQSNEDRQTEDRPTYSYVKSRLQRSRSEAARDIKSWATDGMKGHVLLVRNSRMLVANIIAERELETQLWDLARERNECQRARERDRQLFLRRLALKGERFRDIVVKIESRKKVRPTTVQLPVYQRRALLSRVHEYPLVRRVLDRETSDVDEMEAEALMVHPLPFLSDEVEKHTGDDEILPELEMEPRFHKVEGKSVHARRNIRSTSAIPATKGRYESFLPVKVPARDAVSTDFMMSSELLQRTSVPPEHVTDLDFGQDQGPEVRSRSCEVFGGSPRRPATAPECIHVSQLIDDIDSLHVPSRNPKKTKTKRTFF